MPSATSGWNKALARKGQLDGKFLIGDMKAGIYGLPSCTVRLPKDEDVQLFTTETSAKNAGLRPCKICRPDRFHDGGKASLTLFHDLQRGFSTSPTEFASLHDLAQRANLPADQLEDLFRDHAHMTAAQWLRRVQARRAAEGIVAARPPEFAGADAGFPSTKIFEEAFIAEYAMLPSEYSVMDVKKGFALHLPESYRPDEAVGYHGRDANSPSERAEGRRIWKALHTADGPAIIEIAIGSDRATVKVTTEKNLGRESMAFLQRSALRMLGLSNDISAFEERHPEIVKTRRGLRVPLLPSAFDALCWAITGQQINLAFAATLRRDMINLAGEKIHGMRVHPTAGQLANLGIEPLRKIRYSGSKANYMISFAEQIAGGHLDIEGLIDGSAVAAQEALVSQKGVGIWTARYVMMRTGFADAAPVGDSGLATALQRLYPSEARPDAEEAGRLMFRFSPHRSLASVHLWASLADEK
ncbi:AraC family transcriptional regulator, regulatory protein of adaptative response / DNA-3-methyladenine glycosylase II [Paraburkholderia fungorum]|uniref:DNA-3-methyladenine glycosylase II n=1 Tax=Paraburkholderia fungorum TaxID=134537 RepID=A0A1H1JNP4_9BURK|nr:Ada metal-binding domain-containing protein [Paraburkholderia fungorum]SDR51562.1 AraC family transcriptional regulator, regulatory protein of adaptative response / DNA-3-methyladenine glycosylase II [Paraburkholderia fungorum]